MGRDLGDFIKKNFKKAIDNHEIQVFYQPVIRVLSRQLCSFEALARWIDPEIGMIYPDEFIPVLEKEQAIHLLDAAVLRQVCVRIRSSVTNGEIPIPVSVNLSRLDFTLCDIFSVTDQIVSEYHIPHEFIYFEITESVMAEEQELLKGIVNRFRAAGYQIWMDDFGSAYSSLNALKELNFDEIKLDMRFLRPFTVRSKRIATSVVEMAKRIFIHTLVEGVETEEHFYFLRNIGCEKVQGYYFGKPMPYEEALENLREKGIGVEIPQDRQYYDDLGMINVLSAVPFLTRKEHEAVVTARELNSIPLALVEFAQDAFRVLYYNAAFENTVSGTEMFDLTLNQSMLNQPQPYYRISDKMITLINSVKVGGDGKMLFTSCEEYYEVKARCWTQTRDRYSVLIRITNLSRGKRAENTGCLDKYVRHLYDMYERIILVNYREDNIRPVFTSTQEDLVSGRQGIAKLNREYAEKYIYPEDRERFLFVFDPEIYLARLAEEDDVCFSELFRSRAGHGQYGWREYTLLRIDEDNCFLLTRNLHGYVSEFLQGKIKQAEEDGPYAPARLWDNLLRSGLLRLFWKDRQRRFVGASQAFLDYYGFSSLADIAGKNDEDLGWHIHTDDYMNDEVRVILSGETVRYSPGLCMNQGENKEILASKAPIYDTNGEIKGLIGYFIDRSLLNANDRRGEDTVRRDALTGLLNSRGIMEEAAAFRDEYYRRGTDFVRFHIAVNDFQIFNDQYGFDFGDKILKAVGQELEQAFGRRGVVGRFMGYKFVLLLQGKGREEAYALLKKIKELSKRIRNIDGTPVTLYLAVGFTFFSECPDLKEQAKNCELCLHADHDYNISMESRLAHVSDIFRLFAKLPVSYCVYYVTHPKDGGADNAVFYYVNRKFEEECGIPAKAILGRSVREVYPNVGEEWIRDIKRAALNDENIEGTVKNSSNGKRYHYTASQIIYSGYCAVTFQEVLPCDKYENES